MTKNITNVDTTIENAEVQAVTETVTTTLEAVVPEANNNGQKVSVDALQAPYVEITSVNDTTQMDSQNEEVIDNSVEEEIDPRQSSIEFINDVSTQDVNIDIKPVVDDVASVELDLDSGEVVENKTIEAPVNKEPKKEEPKLLVLSDNNTMAIVKKDGTVINPSKFQKDNWFKDDVRADSPLHELYEYGWEIYLLNNGDIAYRTDDNPFVEVKTSAACKVFSAALGRPISLKYESELKKTELPQNNILPSELFLVSDVTFEPNIKSTYYFKNGHCYRNCFVPTEYMEVEGEPENDTPTINSLLGNLTKSINERFIYLINWLAYCFQLLEKPQTAMLLIGKQGTGKGVLWSIIEELYGLNQTFVLNDKTLKGNFLQTVFQGRMFVFLDEISQGTSSNNKEIKNFVKAITTSKSMALEKKYSNTTKETELKAAVLIASNEYKSMELEQTDRRTTVFEADQVLTDNNFFGHGDYETMWAAIKSELIDFAKFLKNYKVDKSMANKPMLTKEKESLQESTSDKFTNFANAICEMNLEFFEDLKYDESPSVRDYYSGLEKGFEDGYVSKKRLKYYLQYSLDKKISTVNLMRELKVRRPDIFDNEDRMTTSSKDGGDIRFHLDPDYTKAQKEVQQVEPYVQPYPNRATSNPVWPKPPVMDESKKVTQVPPLQNTKVS